MRRDILLFGAAREASSRCENKMLRPFGDTTLFDIYLDKLSILSRSDAFSRVVVAVSRSDVGLWTKACASDVEVSERSPRSVAWGILPRGEELEFLRQHDESHVLFFNGCMPFFPWQHVEIMARRFLAGDAVSTTLARPAHNWFWASGEPVNNCDPRCLSTQGCPPLDESVHAANIYPRQRMLDENVRWSYTDSDPLVEVLDVDAVNLLDVDDDDDFEYCAWKRRAMEAGRI